MNNNQNSFPKGGAITCIIGHALSFIPYIALIILMLTNNLATFFVLVVLAAAFAPIIIMNIAGLIVSCLALKNPKICISLWVLAIFSLNIIAFIGGIINHATRPHPINSINVNLSFKQEN